MDEFSLSKGKVGGGALSAALAGVKYIAIPVIIAIVLLTVIAEADGMIDDAGDGELSVDLAPIQDTVVEIRNISIIFGIPVVAFAFMKGFYPKGSLSRMTFGVLMVASICLWIWTVTKGGDLGMEVEDIGLNIDMTKLVYLFLLGAGIKAAFYVAEFGSYRNEYLAPPQMPMAPVAYPQELANDGGLPEDEASAEE
jgi:hypothetical protein